MSQLLNGHRKFGERSARKIERQAGLPIGYFDTGGPLDRDAPPPREDWSRLSTEELTIVIQAMIAELSRRTDR